MNPVLLDAGPIVALLSPRDAWHEWARETFAAIKGPLVTCEPVLAEASLVLRARPEASVAVMELLVRGFMQIRFRLQSERAAIQTLMNRYRSVPMSLADACLVRMSELEPRASVLTLDSDFRVYRRNGRGVIPLVSAS